jgi:hypothetical protein
MSGKERSYGKMLIGVTLEQMAPTVFVSDPTQEHQPAYVIYRPSS